MLIPVSILLAIAFFIYTIKNSKDDPFFIPGFIVVAAVIVASMIVSYEANVGITNLESFYDATSASYKSVATKTELILSDPKVISSTLVPIDGSIEKTEVGKTVSSRLVEWRDKVEEYNKNLAWYKRFDNDLLLGLHVPTHPERLKYIIIQE